ncbi:MAG: phospholipase D-like domain-containing protein, partial [Candidatus Woesearchaeota archaeon]
DLIEEKNEQNVQVTIIWGKKKNQFKFNSNTKSWIKSMKHVISFFEKDLHAKCYMNEKEAVITSMNLYEASQNNFEMGILVRKNEDPELYQEIFNEVKRLIKRCTKNPSKTTSFIVREETPEYGNEPIQGYCIRCGMRIELNVKHPYCVKDWNIWKKISNDSYKEKKGLCHICGKPNKSSMKSPVCKSCYHKNKHLFNSAK